jgi:hypothetical protein
MSRLDQFSALDFPAMDNHFTAPDLMIPLLTTNSRYRSGFSSATLT